VYRELRQFGRWVSPPGATRPHPTATALVAEAYLRLVDQTAVECHSVAHFFAIAAKPDAPDPGQSRQAPPAAKRGGGNKVALVEAEGLVQPAQVDLVA